MIAAGFSNGLRFASKWLSLGLKQLRKALEALMRWPAGHEKGTLHHDLQGAIGFGLHIEKFLVGLRRLGLQFLHGGNSLLNCLQCL